jgi:hypothetical protein
MPTAEDVVQERGDVLWCRVKKEKKRRSVEEVID